MQIGKGFDRVREEHAAKAGDHPVEGRLRLIGRRIAAFECRIASVGGFGPFASFGDQVGRDVDAGDGPSRADQLCDRKTGRPATASQIEDVFPGLERRSC